MAVISPAEPASANGLRKQRLMDRVREAIRVRHYSRRTEDAYAHWSRRFTVFHGKRHPDELGNREISLFLASLATARRVAAATQNQALSALLFLYTKVLQHEVRPVDRPVAAKVPVRVPVVLTSTKCAWSCGS